MANYGYIRVSTDKQTVENQRMAISKWAEDNKIDISNIKWVEETISGTKDPQKRKLGKLLDVAEADDLIICTELSRLGRSLIMIMNILQEAIDKDVQIYCLKQGIELKNDITTKVIVFAFGLAAELERDLISQRTIEGLERAKAEGSKLGRPKGSVGKNNKLTEQQNVVAELFKRHNTYASVARVMKVDRTTLMRFCKANNIYKPKKNEIENDALFAE